MGTDVPLWGRCPIVSPLAIPSDIAVFRAEIVINTASSFLAHVLPVEYRLDVVKKSSETSTTIY
jgi:hypothetical protein